MSATFAKGKLFRSCTIEDPNCQLTEFYQRVLSACNLHNTENKKVDCREIMVSEAVQQAIIDYYITNNLATKEQVTALLLFAGPKVDANLEGNAVEISDCFLI